MPFAAVWRMGNKEERADGGRPEKRHYVREVRNDDAPNQAVGRSGWQGETSCFRTPGRYLLINRVWVVKERGKSRTTPRISA